MTTRKYESPTAFKQALEDRLRKDAQGIDIQRKRQLVVYQQMLARIIRAFGDTTVLKGGLALELRLEQARTTGDIDLALFGSEANLLERLQAAGQVELDDFMTFEVQPDRDRPEITGEGVLYGGMRYRVECKLAGKIYGAPFGLDVIIGGQMLGAPSTIAGEPYLAFAGISAPVLKVLPVETHLAEKLHAYTLPRRTENSRVRDLPDIALLGTVKGVELLAANLRDAFALTFDARATHETPSALPEPPLKWSEQYKEMAEEQALPWKTLEEVTAAARAFVDPILGGTDVSSWDSTAWVWRRGRSSRRR